MNAAKDWIYSTNVYEVNLRQYTPEGTFRAFAPHLARLKDMGVQTLWFMPITPIAQKNKKGSMGSYYACSHYTAINPEFGSLEDFKSLVQGAQSMGFKVIIDWVANHTGWDHIWTAQHPEWYLKDNATGDFKKASGMDDIIELDYSNGTMRRAMIDAMAYWVEECGIDGFRCDLASWVRVDFWVEAKAALDRIKELFWLAEADALEHPEYMQVFDAAYTWAWMHKTKAFYARESPFEELVRTLERYQFAPGLKAWFTTNHDENTWNGTEYEKYGDLAKALAVFGCTWPGVPLLYSGQELPNHKRLEFFEKDVIQWKEPLELHVFYKTLLRLHAAHPALRADGAVFRMHTDRDDRVLVYQRQSGDRAVLVFINFSPQNLSVSVYDSRVRGTYENVLQEGTADFTGGKSLQLEGWAYAVFQK